jgi:triose/dihydroxyacetone kinase / FAD-AMP lyase (cyclizing)
VIKKLINRPDQVVAEMIEGLVAVYPGLARLPGRNVIVRSDALSARERQVALVSGGGSGHEPAHAGYVGRGMLSAAVAGDVFTSPPPNAVLSAIRASAGARGALLIVKNYTGDRLNFGLAAELARAEGIPVEVVVVADDVALAGATEAAHTGRRGLAGAVLVHKIAGAAADAGLDLHDVAAEARAAAGSVATMGVALSPCMVPGADKPGFTLGEQEVELGLGIHGEPGVRRAPLESADAMTDHLLDAITAEARIAAGERVVLMVNNLGATPTMELILCARRALTRLKTSGVVVERVYVGTFLSALEMAGLSLTLMRVDDARLARLDAPTDAPAWPNPSAVSRPSGRDAPPIHVEDVTTTGEFHPVGPPQTDLGRILETALQAVAQALAAASTRLNTLDQAVGDGDLGLSLRRGAKAIHLSVEALPLDDPSAALHSLGMLLQSALGGTSGPLYAVFLVRAASRLKPIPVDRLTAPAPWAEAFRAGCAGISELGGAGPGDRTMLDALLPASDALLHALANGKSGRAALEAAVEAADAGTKATAALLPRRGRSSYLGERALGHTDPGAEAATVWLRALARALS